LQYGYLQLFSSLTTLQSYLSCALSVAASPLGQGERTEVRGSTFTCSSICFDQPSPSSSPLERERRPPRVQRPSCVGAPKLPLVYRGVSRGAIPSARSIAVGS